ncbi:MAG: tRNA (guanosine(46)-N7)-methyltransferase TrmB [Ponticaulis sp.]|nr:tRNA (guanosine(46)-N7)-methyltransferase TrmB [Ponticaulis sp.]
MTEEKHFREIKTFGRRDGRPLSKRQKHLVDALLPEISLPTDTPICRDDLFGAVEEIWLEIGFGGGEHLVRNARRHSDVGMIGAEPFIDGVAKALTGIDENNLRNVRLHADDVRQVLPNMEKAMIDRAFILFPDPWPKRRQQKRRLIQQAFLDELAHVLRPGAMVRFATDVASYADEALWNFNRHPEFDWQAGRADDWRHDPPDHEPTRYQLKKLGDCKPVWFEFIRR